MRLLSLLLCLAAAFTPEDPLAEAKVDLRDADKWRRRSAVLALAKAGGAEAWTLVIDALADPAGEVADTAQWSLGALADPRALEHLTGRGGLEAKDALVRERAAEALGRVAADVDARDLRDALADREPAVRRAAAAAAGERGAPRIAGDRARLCDALARQATGDRDPRAAGEALAALAALDVAAGRAAWADLNPARAPAAVRCAGARASEALGLSAGALAALGRAQERAVRADAADALARLARAQGPPAARELVAMLAAEADERVARRLVGHLRALSGLKHRRDARPWRDWAARLPADWRPGPAPAGEGAADLGRTSATLIGLPIASDRLTILIDLSGSTWMDRGEGKTRKQVIDRELRACLEALPETTRFNLIAYTHEPLPWKDSLTPATPRNVAAAAAWFEQRREQGTGNFWGAFALALEDPDVDTIVMLGDGEPTGGPRYHLELLPRLVERELLGRGVAVDSIVVDAKARRTRACWQEIARRTGGASLAVEL